MISTGGAKTWFRAAELAELALPGLPKTKRKINERAQEQRWAIRTDAAGQPLARPCAGRGGGLEYHLSLLPPGAIAALVKRGVVQPALTAANDETPRPRDQMWSWFDAQTDAVKREAARRLEALCKTELLEATGLTRTAAMAQTAADYDISVATLWNWRGLVAGVALGERLPRLAPQRKGGGAEADIDPEAWQFFKSLYLQPEGRTWAHCYERLKDFAAPRGLTLPHIKTLQRKLEREVDPRVVILRRQGADALQRTLPPQQRTVAHMRALQLVNIDGHKWDVFVRWPENHVDLAGNKDRIGRPMMVAIQDIYSRKFLAWRIGKSENTALTRLAFADLFKTWGIPEGCVLDNGRAFASKDITGGAKTRFRFKIQPTDLNGLLPALGVQVHWAMPFSGQSKPIERGFRDLCENGAKHPAFHGAYTGNKPDAKPENYGDKAVDLAVFIRVVDKIMAAHNEKAGRRTETARGRSFDETFAESYGRNIITRATEEQRRMVLMAAEQVFADRNTGHITLYDNRFGHEALLAVAGQRVTVRFDPDNLASELHVYRRRRGVRGLAAGRARFPRQGLVSHGDQLGHRNQPMETAGLRMA